MRLPLRIGILGTGFISTEFALAVHAGASPLVRIGAVASRDAGRAQALARRCGAARAHADYATLLADADVDAVYIGLPNSLHAEWAVRSAFAGTHVLCEKPLAPTSAEVQRMIETFERHGLLLLEAFPFQFQPQTLEMQRRITAGEIGAVRVLQATTGFALANPANVRLRPELGGGALLDIGCYCVSLARLVFGRRPLRVRATGTAGATGVDMTTTATLEFADGGWAQLACSMEVGPHRAAILVGTGGVLETSFTNHTSATQPARLRLKRGTAWDATFESIDVATGNGFVLEAEALARIVTSDDVAQRRTLHRLSLDNSATLTAIGRSLQAGGPVDV
ncbi:MAG: Gfo/Idh/MocA family oxidoreductase [Gammaproteobacteria bacterium]|nr:Gfo/Idh/MocA family oxidoreductase [Gammaproteobacteria bacterium]